MSKLFYQTTSKTTTNQLKIIDKCSWVVGSDKRHNNRRALRRRCITISKPIEIILFIYFWQSKLNHNQNKLLPNRKWSSVCRPIQFFLCKSEKKQNTKIKQYKFTKICKRIEYLRQCVRSSTQKTSICSIRKQSFILNNNMKMRIDMNKWKWKCS